MTSRCREDLSPPRSSQTISSSRPIKIEQAAWTITDSQLILFFFSPACSECIPQYTNCKGHVGSGKLTITRMAFRHEKTGRSFKLRPANASGFQLLATPRDDGEVPPLGTQRPFRCALGGPINVPHSDPDLSTPGSLCVRWRLPSASMVWWSYSIGPTVAHRSALRTHADATAHTPETKL